MQFAAAQLGNEDCYRLLTGLVAPRPIAWITSRGSDGVVNLAPFSFFTVASTKLTLPPMVILVIGSKPKGVKKDTVRNILANGEFVIHSATQEMAQAVAQSSSEYPAGVSEAKVLGLDLDPGEMVSVPHLRAAPIYLECKLGQSLELGKGTATLLVAEIQRFFVRDDLIQNGSVDVRRLQPLAHLNGTTFTGLGEIFSIELEPVAS